QRGSNTSDVNRDNQDHGKRSRILAQIKALESEIVELQTEIDERRKERERVIPMDDIMYPREHLLRIIDRINIGESIKTEVAKFVESVENESNLPGFFKGFVQYAKLNHQRTMLFDALKRKFPDLTTYGDDLTHERSMTEGTSDVGNEICHLLRFTSQTADVIFLWRNKASDKGEIFPEVQLYPRMPKQ
ncbi:10325_t:CDS:2, partial [Paraglomus brasilianum]